MTFLKSMGVALDSELAFFCADVVAQLVEKKQWQSDVWLGWPPLE